MKEVIILNTFGERVAHLRKQKNMPQEELAKHLKIGKSTLGMYETNKREPGFEMAHKIADYFGVTVDWLTGDKDIKFKDNIEEFHRDIDISSIDDIFEKYNLKIDGRAMTKEEARNFLAFVRSNRSLEK